MKIVLFDYVFERDRPGTTGFSDVVWELARSLAVIGEEVHIVGPYRHGIRGPEGAKLHSYPLPPINYRNVVGHLLIVLRGWQLIKRTLSQADIIHTPEYLSTAVFSTLGSTPVVLTTPGNIYERIHNVNHFDWITTQVYKLAAKLSARYCARIIATSTSMRKWWEYSGTPPERIVEIPLGVDTHTFSPVEDATGKLGLEQVPRALFVGRLQSENGVRQLVKALRFVVEHVEDAVLDIVGDGPERAELLNLAKALGVSEYIQWHGRVDLEDLPLYYSMADVFVLPRYSCVTPRVLFEAMACRLPVVVSAIDGMQEFVEDGRTGFTVSPDEPQEIASRVVDLLQDGDLAFRLGAAARDYACRYLDWQVIVGRMREEIYQIASTEAHS